MTPTLKRHHKILLVGLGALAIAWAVWIFVLLPAADIEEATQAPPPAAAPK